MKTSPVIVALLVTLSSVAGLVAFVEIELPEPPTCQPIPEPGPLALLGLGLLGLSLRKQ